MKPKRGLRRTVNEVQDDEVFRVVVIAWAYARGIIPISSTPPRRAAPTGRGGEPGPGLAKNQWGQEAVVFLRRCCQCQKKTRRYSCTGCGHKACCSCKYGRDK